jgi:hypothetical protein
MAIATGEVTGFADADNKTPIDEFDRVLAAFTGGADVVIGSRQLAGARIERPRRWYRRLGTMGFAAFVHTLVGLADVPDTQCGFKFFRRDVARDLFSRQVIDGYMFDVEILCLAAEAGYRLVQVPVRWRDDRDSRLHLVGGNLRNAADIVLADRMQQEYPGLACDFVEQIFDRAYATGCYTRAAMGSVWTSQFPDDHGVVGEKSGLPAGPYPTLAEILTSHGVHTAGFVANSVAGPAFGMDRGFAEFREVYREVGIEAATDKSGNPTADGTIYNRLVVPKMRGEGTAGPKVSALKR